MSYVLSNGTIGNAILFFQEAGDKAYTTTLAEAKVFDDLAEAERVALSSRVSHRFTIIDERDKREQVDHRIWDADLLQEAVSYMNSVTEKSIQDSVGLDAALIKKVEAVNPYGSEVEDLSLVLREIGQKKQSALKL